LPASRIVLYLPSEFDFVAIHAPIPDFVMDVAAFGSEVVDGTPSSTGIWTITPKLATVPEPSTFLLISITLLSAEFVARKRIIRRQLVPGVLARLLKSR
jgi:PEP-CTERM motif